MGLSGNILESAKSVEKPKHITRENMKSKATHGGKRKGAGKPALYGEAMTRKNVILDKETIAILKRLGNGKLSAGIRLAAERCK